MGKIWNTILQREFEFRQARTLATIRESEAGGAARRLITGREPHPTGSPTCIKSGFRAVTWESMQSEWPLIRLAEVASPFRYIKSQPHRLDMNVVGGRDRVLTFYPDFQFAVDARFLDDLTGGKPFWAAALDWKPTSESFDWRTLIVETKTDGDRRAVDPAYLHKLDLAREIYRSIGWSFAHLLQSKDLQSGRIALGIDKIWSRALTRVTMVDVGRVSHAIERAGGRLPYEETAWVLGSGPIGKAKLSALHVRRVVSIDLSKGLTPESIVMLIKDRGAIL
ncbi:hypothetical protein [Bradyrhizobium sp. B117]|uniref:hypothetical protein n=1 Tax=Bradyrhizobium sp. B117 TaxID=3140246 RepID=UPI003183DF49